MITEQDFQVPPGVADALRMAAICHTPHTGIAAIALIRAAADILCNDLGAEQTCDVINQVTTEALALHAPGRGEHDRRRQRVPSRRRRQCGAAWRVVAQFKPVLRF